MRRLAPVALLAALLAAPAGGRAPEPFHAAAFEQDFPDPFVLPLPGRGYLAYATNARGMRANVQMAFSADGRGWRLVGRGDALRDALPKLPRWARAGFTWAPEVTRVGDGYVLHFTARDQRSGRQCIGAATAADPFGPFRSDASEPLVCQRELGGSIDASAFRDADGSLILYWKSDGNNPDVLKPSKLWAARLSADGLRLTGEPVELLRNTEHWEWRVVESPTMLRDDRGRYVLLYSGNHYGWEADQPMSNYAIGYARCASALGPCVKAPENPILKSINAGGECLSGPGHQTVFESAGKPFIVFHSWAAAPGCTRATAARHMHVAPLTWTPEGAPVIGQGLRP